MSRCSHLPIFFESSRVVGECATCNRITGLITSSTSTSKRTLGTYGYDCSGFVGFVFKQVAPDHYAVVPKEANEPRPRALEYYDFLAALAPGSTGGWHEFELPGDARCGDINAWRFAEIKVGQDAGRTVRGRDSKTGCRDIYGSRI